MEAYAFNQDLHNYQYFTYSFAVKVNNESLRRLSNLCIHVECTWNST